jgi:hypothetical protein
MAEAERMGKEATQIREEAERRQKELAFEKARESALKLARLLLKTGASVEETARETGLP